MRIISQLMPNGQPISTDIESTRQPGKEMWEIPTWGRPLSLGVYPLFLRKYRALIPVGTAFCISKLGFSFTAQQNILQAACSHWHEDIPQSIESLSIHSEAKGKGAAVFHHRVLSGDRLSGSILGLSFIAGSDPLDLCYVLPQFRSGFPYLPLPLSFAIPRPGSRVVCVGFRDLSTPDGPFSLDDIESGRVNLLDVYKNNLFAIEARVTRIFTQRFARGFIDGPCVTIDSEIKQGMCGGPVFSENGYVCGVLSANASNFFNKPASIVSLLSPALGMNIRFGGQIGNVRLSSKRRLIDLIQQGLVMTDGTENLLPIQMKENGSCPSPAVHEEDAACTYDDLAGFQKVRPPGRNSNDACLPEGD